MRTVATTTFAAAAVVLTGSPAGTAQAGPASVQVDGDCRTVRIKADGRRVVTPARNVGQASGGTTVTARSGGAVSMSSSSGSGSGRSVSTSSVNGVTVTVTRDETGCTAVIDERSTRGRNR